MTKEELVKVVKWKLRVGAFRPSLERFASETDPAQVTKNVEMIHVFLTGRHGQGAGGVSERLLGTCFSISVDR